MRTVSFSSPQVQKLLTDDFVCHIINSEGDPSAGMSQAHAPTDPAGFCSPGIGSQNVQTLFLTPEGKIFHTASGFRGPADLADEIQVASDVFEQLQTEPAVAARTIPAMHRQRLLDQGVDGNLLDNDALIQNDVARMMREFQSGLRGAGQMGNRGNSLLSSMRNGRVPQQMEQLGQSVFAGRTQQARMNDYRFAVNHPLMPLDELLDNPRSLVGNGVSAFASGSASGGKIGGQARPNSFQSTSRND